MGTSGGQFRHRIAHSVKGLEKDACGEFLFSLFAVISISISLLRSWLVAVRVKSLLGSYFFKLGGLSADQSGYDGPIFRAFGRLVRWVLKLRWLVIMGSVGTTVVCVLAFSSVKKQFFLPASTLLFYLEYKAGHCDIRDVGASENRRRLVAFP